MRRIGLLLLVAMLTAQTVRAQSLAKPRSGVPHWEYAELSFASDVWTWTVGDSTYALTSPEEAARAFGVPQRRTSTMLNNAILNQIGRAGWEMVSVSTEDGKTYYFKRPS
jgi:hypothetical protein